MYLHLFILLLLWPLAYPSIFPYESWEVGDIPLEQTGTSKTLFYYLFRSRHGPPAGSLVIWLNGGPGSASAIGMMLENGPYSLNKTLGLVRNPHSWNSFHDVLYVDQPAGVGYSKLGDPAQICRNETCIAKEFYTFLLRFYSLHPEYSAKPLYLTGESYGGHYLPAIGAYLLRANNPILNLQGVAIGNGFTDSAIHFTYAPNFLYHNGLISLPAYVLASAAVLACNLVTVVGLHPYMGAGHDYCTIIDFAIVTIFNVTNPYDIRSNESYAPKVLAVQQFFEDPKVKAGLGTEGRNFTPASKNVSAAMELDQVDSMLGELNFMVQSGCRVLLYYGDKDYVCNWMGGEALAHSVEWGKKKEFNEMKYKDWNLEGEKKGEFKQIANFALLIVANAGHLVPMNVPKEALAMLEQFINGTL